MAILGILDLSEEVVDWIVNNVDGYSETKGTKFVRCLHDFIQILPQASRKMVEIDGCQKETSRGRGD